jgi:hypothetical protein
MVDPRKNWLPSAGRNPVAQQWHDVGEMHSRKNRPKIRLGTRRNVSLIPEGCPAVQQWHGARGTTSRKISPKESVHRERKWQQQEKLPALQDTDVRDETKTMSHQDTWKEGRHAIQKWHDKWKMPSEKFVPRTLWYEEPGKDGLPDGDNWYARKAPRKPRIETSQTSYSSEASGHRGGVDPLQNEKREMARMGETGGISTGLPSKNEWEMDESEEWMWYYRQATEVLGASTLEEGGWMDESQLEEPRTEEVDIKTKERRR